MRSRSIRAESSSLLPRIGLTRFWLLPEKQCKRAHTKPCVMLPSFDRSRLIIKPLAERKHDLSIEQQLPMEELPPPLEERAMNDIAEIGRRMAVARERGAASLLL